MAKYRPVHTKLWSDSDIESLPGLARCLLAYLITNAHRNEAALYSMSLTKIAFEMGFPVEDIEQAMSHLVAAKKAFYDREASVVWVKNAVRYQTLNKNCIVSIKNDIAHCSSATLAKAFCEYYKNYGNLGTVCQSFLNHSQTVSNGFANPPLGLGLGLEEGGVGGETGSTPKPKASRLTDDAILDSLKIPASHDTPEFRAEFARWVKNRRSKGSVAVGWLEFFQKQITKLASMSLDDALTSLEHSTDNGYQALVERRASKSVSCNSGLPPGYHTMDEMPEVRKRDPGIMEKIEMCRHADDRQQYWVYRHERKPVLEGFRQFYPEARDNRAPPGAA